MIFLKAKKRLVVATNTLLRRRAGMGTGFELCLDEYNHMAHMNYPFDGMTRSILWVHLTRSFRERGDGMCSIFSTACSVYG